MAAAVSATPLIAGERADRTRQPAVVALRDITKTYDTAAGGTVHALSSINLEVGSGEFVSVLGASGCGKTTLLRIIGGLEDDYGGELLMHGRKGGASHPDVGIVFQDRGGPLFRTCCCPRRSFAWIKTDPSRRPMNCLNLSG